MSNDGDITLAAGHARHHGWVVRPDRRHDQPGRSRSVKRRRGTLDGGRCSARGRVVGGVNNHAGPGGARQARRAHRHRRLHAGQRRLLRVSLLATRRKT